MATDFTRRIGGVAAALLCCVSLAACNSAPSTSAEGTESSTESTETAAAPTTAAELLDATTESGTMHAISSWSLETSELKSTTTYTYDDAGNVLEQKTEGSYGDVTTTETVTNTYDGNLPASRKYVNEAQGQTSEVDTTFAEPEYKASGDTATLTVTNSGKQNDPEADMTFSETYDLADGGKTVTGVESSSKMAATSGTEAESPEISSSQAFIFDSDGNLTELNMDLMGSTGSITLSYDGDTMKAKSDDSEQTWTLTKDEDGCITKAVNEEAGATITINYTDIENPTDFNRATSKVAPASVLGSGVYGLWGSDLASGLQQLNASGTSTSSSTTSTTAE